LNSRLFCCHCCSNSKLQEPGFGKEGRANLGERLGIVRVHEAERGLTWWDVTRNARAATHPEVMWGGRETCEIADTAMIPTPWGTMERQESGSALPIFASPLLGCAFLAPCSRHSPQFSVGVRRGDLEFVGDRWGSLDVRWGLSEYRLGCWMPSLFGVRSWFREGLVWVSL
jgi:hypothetical protein